VCEESDWKRVPTERRQWRTAAARVKTRAREGRPRLANKRAGRSVGVGTDVPVPLACVGRPRAWPRAPAANGAPQAVHRLVDQRHLTRPLATDGTRECSPALRSGQRSHQHLGVCARSGYDAYGGGRRGCARRRARMRPGVPGAACISLISYQNCFSPIFQTKLQLRV
jgi:hypothetical protein